MLKNYAHLIKGETIEPVWIFSLLAYDYKLKL